MHKFHEADAYEFLTAEQAPKILQCVICDCPEIILATIGFDRFLQGAIALLADYTGCNTTVAAVDRNLSLRYKPSYKELRPISSPTFFTDWQISDWSGYGGKVEETGPARFAFVRVRKPAPEDFQHNAVEVLQPILRPLFD